jgi:hypothetical protein
MQAHEVEIRSLERDRLGVVFDLFANRVRQVGEPAHVHPHCEVPALNEGRADVLEAGEPSIRVLLMPAHSAAL